MPRKCWHHHGMHSAANGGGRRELRIIRNVNLRHVREDPNPYPEAKARTFLSRVRMRDGTGEHDIYWYCPVCQGWSSGTEWSLERPPKVHFCPVLGVTSSHQNTCSPIDCVPSPPSTMQKPKECLCCSTHPCGTRRRTALSTLLPTEVPKSKERASLSTWRKRRRKRQSFYCT